MIKKAQFIKSAASIKDWPQYSYGELVFLGRSNVGKSSFINALANQKRLAKISSTPGKTQLINFFDINDHEFVLVDTPGYGYSKISKEKKATFGKLMEDYLLKRGNLRAAVLLLDLRHKPTNDDQKIYHFLKTIGKRVFVVGTKLDKLKRNDYEKHEKMVKETINFDPKDIFLRVSSLKKTNLDEVYKILIDLSIERE